MNEKTKAHMSRKKVTLVTLDILPQLAPLTAGYLQSYASRYDEVRNHWSFEQFVSTRASQTPERLLAAMEKSDADLYCFSCYAWNMGLIREILPHLLREKPTAKILLGGPQVMNCAPRYLMPEYENLMLCNGEGEKTFANCLMELNSTSPDLSQVKGLSYYCKGQLHTTEPEPRMVDLDEIPSPVLGGVFDPSRYMNMVLETNRGCPFTCHYCYWGGAIGTKVHKFSTERIQQELTWMAQNNIFSVAIVDANWGIYQRDVELSRYLVECKRSYGSPKMVGFSASKNTPQRVTEITKIFHDAELLLNHTISLQTMQGDVLKNVGRQNIKTEDYLKMQQYMNEEGMSSHIELIWPLPGETLASFIGGVDQLCDAGADMFFCHPLFLINNIELNKHREEFGLVVIDSPDSGGESEIVVQTKTVSRSDYGAGWRFVFVTLLLHNLRALYCLPRYLRARHLDTFAGLYSRFMRYLEDNPQLPLSQLIADISRKWSVEPITLGRLADTVYIDRASLDSAIIDFFSQQPWCHDEGAQFCLELDLINRPQIYHIRPAHPRLPYKHLALQELQAGGFRLAIPPKFLAIAKEYLGGKAQFEATLIYVDHEQGQTPRIDHLPAEACWMQCYQSSFNIAKYAPVWRPQTEHSIDGSAQVSG
jgi:putative methyltransferase